MTDVTTEQGTTTFTQETPAPAQDVVTVDTQQGALTIPEGPGALLAATLQLAANPNFDPAKLQVMLDMQYKLEDRQAEREFAVALAAAQADIPQVSRLGIVDLNKKGETYDVKKKYNFARLEDIDAVLRSVMQQHGFSIWFNREQREGGGLVVTGTLSHKAGATRTASFPVPLDTGPGRNNLQAAGSSDSYAKRYILEGFFKIVRKGKDDDGNTTDPLLKEEIEDLMELLTQTRSDHKSFLAMAFDEPPEPEDDPVLMLEKIQRGSYERLHKLLAAKLHNMKKRSGKQEEPL